MFVGLASPVLKMGDVCGHVAPAADRWTVVVRMVNQCYGVIVGRLNFGYESESSPTIGEQY